eukprot:TRINITY_DN6304_c0_g1_i1.p2 TRINITY_DN6304_c0_g1~~TRINITY_DN6304_c0_g1_i1.p2  ORF type:complete len:206 (-),score=35.29 TRINITY_DN6304_c0_g1_i1:82-699(-)
MKGYVNALVLSCPICGHERVLKRTKVNRKEIKKMMLKKPPEKVEVKSVVSEAEQGKGLRRLDLMQYNVKKKKKSTPADLPARPNLVVDDIFLTKPKLDQPPPKESSSLFAGEGKEGTDGERINSQTAPEASIATMTKEEQLMPSSAQDVSEIKPEKLSAEAVLESFLIDSGTTEVQAKEDASGFKKKSLYDLFGQDNFSCRETSA